MKLGEGAQIYCKTVTQGESGVANRKLENLDATHLARTEGKALAQLARGWRETEVLLHVATEQLCCLVRFLAMARRKIVCTVSCNLT